jgi:uncharacterized coiled-coil protein SlyX
LAIGYDGNGDGGRFIRPHRISIGLGITVVLQAIAFTVWLVQMHDGLVQLKIDHAELTTQMKMDREELRRRIEALDQTGSRAVQLLQQRMVTLEGQNSGQEAHLHDLDVKVGDLQRQATENKVWVDQLVAAVRAFSHNYLPPPNSNATPDRFRLQGDFEPEGKK